MIIIRHRNLQTGKDRNETMYTDGQIYMGLADGQRVNMQLNMSNRHGLIAGASGTGKTITMKAMAESFSDAGVPVFLCDVKGDVSGIATAGVASESMDKRIDKFGIRDSFSYKAYPVCFWDIYQEGGHPVRATISDMGPELLSRILGLTAAQEGVLNIVFRIADDKGLLLIDLKDLRILLNYVAEHKDEYITTYGTISKQSVGGILRALLPLENQGGDLFFGEPDLDIYDWMRTDVYGKGIVNVLNCVKLVQKIEQVVKLIRSKGVGIYFVTQSPSDIPDSVLAQLSNRVQHALRAYTPAEQKAVRAAAQSLRANPAFKAEEVIMELGVGEALTSFLDENGVPGIAQRTSIICPQSFMGPVDETERRNLMARDGMGRYDEAVDNISAYEVLTDTIEHEAKAQQLAAERAQLEKDKEALAKQQAKLQESAVKKKQKEWEAAQKKKEKAAERRQAQIERQLINTGAQVIKRGILSTLFGK